MNDLERRLGLDLDEVADQVTVCALLRQQLHDLDDPAYVDPPPDVSLLPTIHNVTKQAASSEDVKRLSVALTGQMEVRPLPVLLVKTNEAEDDLGESHAGIVAKTVHLCLGLAEMGDEYADEIIRACRRARLLISRDNEVLSHVPSFRASFADIAKSLELRAAEPPEGLEYFAPRFEEWRLSFSTYVDGRQKHSRHAFGSDVFVAGELIEHPSLDDADASLIVSEDAIAVPFPNSPEEVRNDQPKAGKAVRALVKSTSSDRSRGAAFYQGKEILNRLFMNHAAPISLDSRLTPHQVCRAFDLCYRQATKSAAHLLTSLVILTGRRPDKLAALKMHRRRQPAGPGEYWLVELDRVYLWYEPELPKHEKVAALKGIQKAKDNGIRMVLPRRLSKALIKLYRGNSGLRRAVDTRPAISDVVKLVDKKITAIRLSHSLTHALTSQGIDEVTIAWLSGGAPKHNAGMYYTLVNRNEAASAYVDFANSLLEHVGVKERIMPTEDQTFVGTRIRINPKFIARSFQLQAEELKVALHSSSATCMYAFHNRYVLYVAQLLGMVTLIRSVTEPFGRHDDTNLLAKTMRIADKANRIGVNGRLVALGRTASKQLAAYDRHIRELYRELRHERPETAVAIQASIDGSGSYLFNFGADSRIQAMRPKLILEELKDVWPFPTNWARHSMSAWIRKQGFSKGAIRAVFGHSDFGAAPLSRFDATAILELSSIADVIDDYLCKHNIRSIDGWNTRI